MESLNTIDLENRQKYVKRFFLGILIFSIATNFFSTLVPGKILNIIQLFGLFVWGFYWLKLFSWANISNKYLWIILSLVIIWEIFILCHGFVFNIPLIKEFVFVDNRLLSYLMPLTLFVCVNDSSFLQKLFDYCYKLGLVFLAAFPLAWLLFNKNHAEQYVWVFAMGCGFVLLTSFYHSRKRMVISLIVTVLALFFITIMARRNIMITCALFLFFALLIVPLFNKKISISKKAIHIFLFIFMSFLGYSFYMNNQHGIFSKITKRATADTREMVFLYYFLDMTPTDFVIGKGINGSYFCPNVDRDWVEDSGGKEPKYRDLDDRVYIECGYLQLILNGGVIYLFFYLLIMLPAFFKGLFMSKNLFSKSCAILIIMHLIDMAPFGLPTFSWRQLLLWTAVAVCYSKKMRKKSDEEIRDFLYPQEQVAVCE